MEGWLEVELAVTEALADAGVVPADDAPRLPRARGVHGRGGRGARARRPTTTSPPSSTSSPRRSAPEGRWIHYGLTSSDVLDTALATADPRRRRDRRRRRARLPRRADRAGARAPRHRLRRPHPRHPRRADQLRPAARRLRLRGRPQPRPPRARVRRDRGRQALRRRRHLRLAAAGVEARVMERLGLGVEDASTQVVPRDRHADLLSRDRPRRRRARALRDRGPQPPADRGPRGRGAVRQGPEGLLGDAAQAQPDHDRADHRARPRAPRLRAGRARERRPLARARHLPLRRRAGDPPRRDDRARLHAAPRPPGSRAG